MSVTATARRPTADVRHGAGGASGDGRFVGTGTLVRFMLRRDRVKLPAWTLGIAAFWLYYTRLVPSVYETQEDLEGAAQLMEGPMGRMFAGPSYGFEALTDERFVVGAYSLYVLLVVALMSILAVVRHTRVEEQTGRAELVRANVVGRRAPLTAALLVTLVTNVVAAVGVGLVTVTAPGFGAGGAVLLAAATLATGLAFAGVAAVTAQLTEFARAAAGLAGGGLGAAFLLRALGDITSEGGSFVSWLSPLGWSQQTAPYVLDRWWPLALSIVFAAATTALGFTLAARRDVGASMFAARAGPSHAPTWLRSPFTLALRLQRASIVGWAASLVTAGLGCGAWADAMADSADDLPEIMIDVTGGAADEMVAGYLGMMALFMALIVGIYAVLAVQGLRTEETTGRAEPVLATAVDRRGWLGANLAATAIGVVALLAATGVATGIGAALVTGEIAHVGEVTGAHVAYAPAVLLVLTVAAAFYGLAPRIVAVAWIPLAYGLANGIFGPAMDLPAWALRLSPFEHVGRAPQEAVAPIALVILATLAGAVAVLALIGFRRRDVNT